MRSLVSRFVLSTLSVTFTGLATPVIADAERTLSGITVHALTLHAASNSYQLIAISAAQPGRIARSVTLSGLDDGERLLGIDYRVAYGVMFALGSSNRVFTVDVVSGALTPVGTSAFASGLEGERFGFDFNPAADRIRIVSERGLNLRVHPETSAIVDYEPDEAGLQPDAALSYAVGDLHAGQAPRIVAAAYTYNTEDEKLTTNFAIDAARGTLVRQGSIEGQQPVVSPNSGQLHTVGALGIEGIVDAHFDISDVTNTALAAVTTTTDARPTLFRIDLGSGKAEPIGIIGTADSVLGLAIEP